MKSKIDYLTSKGWKHLLTENNWVDTNKIYNLPDWVGLSLEEAFVFVTENESKYENTNYNSEKVIVSYETHKFIGEVVEIIQQHTMDGVMIEQYLVKSISGIHLCYKHQIENVNVNEIL